MTRRWLLVGLMGLGPVLADANWRESTGSSPAEPASPRAQAIAQASLQKAIGASTASNLAALDNQ